MVSLTAGMTVTVNVRADSSPTLAEPALSDRAVTVRLPGGGPLGGGGGVVGGVVVGTVAGVVWGAGGGAVVVVVGDGAGVGAGDGAADPLPATPPGPKSLSSALYEF